MFVRRPEQTWWGIVGSRLGVLAIALHVLFSVLHANVALAAVDSSSNTGILAAFAQICSQSGILGSDTDGGSDADLGPQCAACCHAAGCCGVAARAAEPTAWRLVAAINASRTGKPTQSRIGSAGTHPRAPPAVEPV